MDYINEDVDLRAKGLRQVWYKLGSNPNIFVYDYESMKRRSMIFVEELMQKCFHPKNIKKFTSWGYNDNDYDWSEE